MYFAKSGAGVGSPIYIGQQYDGSTGYNYLNARYENSNAGRFISEDPIFVQSPESQNIGNPQDLNSYSYSDDNPIRYEDPNGKFVQEAFTIAGGAAFSVGALYAADYLTGAPPPTWQQVAGAAAGGAVGGALLGTGVGAAQGLTLIAQAGGLGSLSGALVTDGLDAASGQKVTAKKLAVDSVTSYATGYLFSGAGGAAASRFTVPISNALSESTIAGLNSVNESSYSVNQVSNAYKPVVSNTINYASQVAQGVTQNYIPTNVQSAGQSLNYIQQEINYIQQEINNLTRH